MSDATDETTVPTPTDEAVVTPVHNDEPFSVDPSDGVDSTSAPAADAGDSDTTDATTASASSDTPIYDGLGGDAGEDGGAVDSTAPTPSDEESGAEPSAPTEYVEGEPTGVDAHSGYDKSRPGSDEEGFGGDAPEPEDYSGDIAPGKDGTSPDVNQPTIDELGGPGVAPSVSLSPTEEGIPEALSSDEEPDTEPVIVRPDEARTSNGLEPTFVTQSTLQTGISGHTPLFRGTKLGSVISIRRVGWIGPETFDVQEDSVDELIGLVTALRDA